MFATIIFGAQYRLSFLCMSAIRGEKSVFHGKRSYFTPRRLFYNKSEEVVSETEIIAVRILPVVSIPWNILSSIFRLQSVDTIWYEFAMVLFICYLLYLMSCELNLIVVCRSLRLIHFTPKLNTGHETSEAVIVS